MKLGISLISHPIALRFSGFLIDSKIVTPEPINGSKMVSPSLDKY